MHRKEPPLSYALPRLISRLPKDFSQIDFLEKQLYRVRAGYLGEKYIDNYLSEIDTPISMTVLTDIQLSSSLGIAFQIDTIILTNHFLLILDVKNMSGNLRFTTNPNQLEQTLKTGEVNIMDCPIDQLKSHIYCLQTWLEERGIQVKIMGRIVLSNSNCRVLEAPPNAPIIYKKSLAVLLREKSKNPVVYSSNLINKIEDLIQRNKVTYNPFPLCSYFAINPANLKKGQLCPSCSETMSHKSHVRRHCIQCKIIEFNNYQESIKDYFMLINDSISNLECRDFLQLKNKDAAYYAINSLPLNRKGKSVATRYHWPKGKPYMTND